MWCECVEGEGEGCGVMWRGMSVACGLKMRVRRGCGGGEGC